MLRTVVESEFGKLWLRIGILEKYFGESSLERHMLRSMIAKDYTWDRCVAGRVELKKKTSKLV